jgi:hypothetical protein
LAHEFQVASPLSIALQELGLRDALPQPTLDCLGELAATVRRLNMRVVAQVVEVARILNRVDVTPVLLKGGANLLRGLYPDFAMRTMTDLDVLVPAAMLDSCTSCLRKEGFQPLSDYCHPRGHHYPPLAHPELPLPIELHHRVLAHPYDGFLTAEEVRKSAVTIDGHGVSIAVAAPSCAVVHNVAHAQLNNHDYLYGRIDVRSLVDFALLSRAYDGEINWHEIRGRFDPSSTFPSG